MTTVQFTQDYRGHLTNENYYTAGTVASFAEGPAAALVEAGRAVVVLPPQAAVEAENTTPVPSVADVEKARVTSVTSTLAQDGAGLSGLTVAELRELAKAAEVDGYSKMKKADLVAALGK